MEDSTSKYSYFIINEDYEMTPSGDSDNEWMQEAVEGTGSGYLNDPILDFTEKNPFGDP